MSSILSTVRSELLSLHQALIAAVRIDFERTHGRVTGSGELLELVMNDAGFAWLRPFSQLIVRVDAQLEEPAIAIDSVLEILDELGDLISTPSYLKVLQNVPEVVLAHGRLHQALRGARRPLAA